MTTTPNAIPVRIQLTPDEQARYNATSLYLDGFVDGAKSLADKIKSRTIQEILGARSISAQNPEQQPTDHPKE